MIMVRCDCADWVALVHYVEQDGNAAGWQFCPWCGKELVSVQTDTPAHEVIDETMPPSDGVVLLEKPGWSDADEDEWLSEIIQRDVLAFNAPGVVAAAWMWPGILMELVDRGLCVVAFQYDDVHAVLVVVVEGPRREVEKLDCWSVVSISDDLLVVED